MLKFKILDDCNFGVPYLLHTKFVLTMIVELDSYLNLVYVVKIQLNPRCYEDLACILVQGGLVLDCICSVKHEAFFIVARLFLDTRKKIHDFFWY